jgi:EXLDI family protein
MSRRVWGLASIPDIRILLRIPIHSTSRSYDGAVPNKTIYVSDDDQTLFRRAQELAGGNLSAAIATALRRYVDVEEGRSKGFDEITVRVGAGAGRKVRFSGVLLGEWAASNAGRWEQYRVYRTRTGKFAVYTERSADWTVRNADGKPAGWRGYLGIGDLRYGSSARDATLDVVETVDELRERVPPELFEMVASMARQPVVEDLDI